MTRNRIGLFLLIAAPLATCMPSTAPAAEPGAAQGPEAISVPQLMKNLDSDDLRVSSSAARSLGVIFAPGGKGGEELPAVTKMLIERLASPKGADLRRESAVALGKMRAASAADGLKKAMADEDVLVAMAAGEAVGQVLSVDDARGYLIKRAEEESESVKLASLHGLAPICKPEDVPVLRKGLAARNWRTQMAAVKGLQRAAQAGAKIAAEDYDGIAAVLGNEVRNAADAALNFFVNVHNPESFRAVLKAAETKDGNGPDDGAWRTRAQSLRVVRRLGWPATRDALPVVIRNLGDRTTNVTNQAKGILAGLRKEHLMSQGELFPLFVAELEKAESLPVRAGIMEEMGRDVDRAFASRVGKVAIDTLTKSMEDKPQWSARAHSLVLLAASGSTGAMEMVAACAGDNVTNVREAAGHALEALSPLCSAKERGAVAPVLQPLLVKTEDWRKTAVAARAIGHYAGTEAVAPLVQLLGHNVLNVREAASHSLVLMVSGENKELRAEVEKAVQPEMEKNERAWECGAPVLGALKQAKAVPVLTTVLQRGDWRAKAAAAKAAEQIAAAEKITDKPLSDALIQAAQSDVVQVHEAANKALRVINQGK
jgi:HEAT repeat protein